MHNFAFFLIVGEILLKIPLCLFLYKEFSESQGSIKDLVNFDYKPKSGEWDHEKMTLGLYIYFIFNYLKEIF